MSRKYNGWSSYTAWNVALWLTNNSPVFYSDSIKIVNKYDQKQVTLEQALNELESLVRIYYYGMKTPDGYNISRRSMKEWFLAQL